ncbi:MAG: hypothetical protein ACPG8A_10440 [Psychrobium sp.]
MIGIIALAVLIVFLLIIHLLTSFILVFIRLKKHKDRLYSVIFLALVASVFLDEIIGQVQFRALCVPENLLIYDENKVKGKVVVGNNLPTIEVQKILPMSVSSIEWKDAETNEVIITSKIYLSKGGWLSRFIGFPQGNPPYTFDGKCSSQNYYALFEKFNITRL